MTGAWLLLALFVYLGVGAFVSAPFRDRPAHKHPQLEQVRDVPLDITPALRGRR